MTLVKRFPHFPLLHITAHIHQTDFKLIQFFAKAGLGSKKLGNCDSVMEHGGSVMPNTTYRVRWRTGHTGNDLLQPGAHWERAPAGIVQHVGTHFSKFLVVIRARERRMAENKMKDKGFSTMRVRRLARRSPLPFSTHIQQTDFRWIRIFTKAGFDSISNTTCGSDDSVHHGAGRKS